MLDYLTQSLANGPAPDLADVFVRLLVAVVMGIGVSWIYRISRPHSDVPPTFPGTLVLLAVLIAMVTLVIGNNVARAFSLVGALSIVRFRTVVRDTQDTAFVIFAVVIGMAVGALDLVVAGVGFVIVSGAAFLMKPRGRAVPREPPCSVALRVGLGADVEALVGRTLDGHMRDREVASMSTAQRGLALDVAYRGWLREGAGGAEGLVRALNLVEGVQRVEYAAQAVPVDRE